MKTSKEQNCHCHNVMVEEVDSANITTKSTIKSIGSMCLSILIAFFPKCPICLAAYLSMFGSISLARSPIMGWLFPFLISVLGIHLFLLFKKSSQKGYGPFLISVIGATLILTGRSFLPDYKFILWTGMMLILAGSLWNSFSFNRFNTTFKINF
jgi:mercuric ion transport protein